MNHTPVTESEMSVEQALAELREIFPGFVCEIAYRTAGIATIRMTVWAKSIISVSLFNAYADTLNEALAQVRKWKQEQS